MPYLNLPIKYKILIITLLTSFLALALTIGVMLVVETFRFRRTAVDNATSLSQLIEVNASAALAFGDKTAAQETLSALSVRGDIRSTALYTRDGTVLAEYHSDKPAHDPGPTPPPQGPTHYFETDSLVMFRDVMAEKEKVGTLYLRTDLRQPLAAMAQRAQIGAAMIFLALLVAAVAATRLQRVISAPLQRLTRITERVGEQKDYSLRAGEEDRKDEIGVLTRAFNNMLSQIQEKDGALRAARDELERKVEERTQNLRAEILERKRAEEQLRVEKERAQQYLNLSAVMFVALDAQGNVTMINRTGCDLTGYPEVEIIGKNWFDLVVREHEREEIKAVFNKLMEGGHSPSDSSYHENVIRARDGSERIMAWHNVPLRDERGQVVGTLSSGEDVTAKKRLADELLRTQKLETIGTFAGGIAHDFNNFLMSILGNIDLARESLDDRDEAARLLQEASTAAAQATNLTKQLITFAKGGQPIMKPIALPDLVRNATIFSLSGSSVRHQLIIPDDLWAVNADAGQLQQVIANLIINARQAMPRGGTIHVTLSNVREDAATELGLPPQRYVSIRIRDEGIGIPQELLTKIFDPYFTTKPEGNGLGLTTVYSIVRKHGGHLAVNSRVGEGATFSIYLPATREKPADAAKKGPPALLPRSVNVLIMDDDPTVGRTVCSILKRLKCEAVLAPNGEKALELYGQALAQKAPFEMVILDLVVQGGMGGRETAQRLLQMDPKVKMVVSSGYSDDHIVSHHKEYGFRASITKPYDPRDLLATIHQVLGI